MSHSSEHELKPIDRYALWSMCGFLCLVVLFVFLSNPAPQDGASLELVESRSLIFKDGPSGTIVVINADTQEELLTLQTNEDGFTRTAVRALAYNRRLHDVEPEVPITLGKTAAGRIIIHDPSTDKSIRVGAFGELNAAQLNKLLETSIESS